MLDKIPKIISFLNKHKVEYVIIGGYAIIIHGFLRATEDIDLVLKMTHENVSKFQKALLTIYNDNDINEINFSELSNYSVIRYGTPDNYYIDVISKIGELFNYDNISKEIKIIDGIEFITATAESLYEMKKNTYREKDKLDILFLKEKLGK
jgi:hypothetical protein